VHPQGSGRWRFEGGGFGHGAGLSQAGAIELADRGWDTRRILLHYYHGTSLERLDQLRPGPHGNAP
jgi:SpoIID/LytB domain protein